MKPPVPGVDASRWLSGENTWALPAVRTIWSSVTSRSRSCFGSTCTWSCWSRMPQIATFATPGTPIRRGRIVQRASTDLSIAETSSEERPIISTRLDDDSGWSTVGGSEMFGHAAAPICVRRSCTSCRPRYTSVLGSNTSTIEDIPGTDSERMTSTP
jgi:hypothetical protein